VQIRFKADFWRSVIDDDELRDDQFDRLKVLVPGGCKGKRGPRTETTAVSQRSLWMARSGGRWRDLPSRLGDYLL